MTSRGYDVVREALAPVGAASVSLSLDRVCSGCGELFDLDGASVLVSGGRETVAGLTTSGPLAAQVEKEQFVLGEGPGVSAAVTGRPEFITDMASERRFPAFAAAGRGLGLGAAFAFPLALGVIRLGALSMYRCAPGALESDDVGDALLVADVVTMLLLADQSGSGSGGLSWAMDDLVAHRAVVHQATGMVATQIGRPLDHALVRLRAHSFAAGLDIDDVAEQVVSRRLRFEGDPSTEIHPDTDTDPGPSSEPPRAG